jgi:hypothetical protein
VLPSVPSPQHQLQEQQQHSYPAVQNAWGKPASLLSGELTANDVNAAVMNQSSSLFGALNTGVSHHCHQQQQQQHHVSSDHLMSGLFLGSEQQQQQQEQHSLFGGGLGQQAPSSLFSKSISNTTASYGALSMPPNLSPISAGDSGTIGTGGGGLLSSDLLGELGGGGGLTADGFLSPTAMMMMVMGQDQQQQQQYNLGGTTDFSGNYQGVQSSSLLLSLNDMGNTGAPPASSSSGGVGGGGNAYVMNEGDANGLLFPSQGPPDVSATANTTTTATSTELRSLWGI